ncbi:MAG: hypothetical protein IKF22_12505 [Lachnospiraceae bacterium]|jgi:hypothetical protein|nr:hypothetical protein [Lachnospiraceae bacterium]
MKCPYCGNETGNNTVCPYCGHRVYETEGHHTYYTDINPTVPVNYSEKSTDAATRKHLANIDTWGLMSVILLAGIFIIELLQLLMQFV